MKKYFVIVIGILLAGILFSNLYAESKAKDYVKVVYFHGDVRCMTCNKIERYIKSTVNEYFKNELKSGKVVLEHINYDKKENEHYMKDYNLFNQTLIISNIKNGKEIKWKNAEKIWELVSNKEKFQSYVKSEVEKSLKGL